MAFEMTNAKPLRTDSNIGHRLSIRTLLNLVVIACVLQAVLGTSLLLVHNYSISREQRVEDTVQTARALVQAVDAQIVQIESLALALTTSDSLVHRNFAAFHQRALRLISETPTLQSVHIYSRDGAPLVNTRVPFGQSLPRRSDLKQIKSVFESGKSSKPEVILNPLTHTPVISIVVPVLSGDKVAFVLAMGIAPNVFSSILSKQNLPPNWLVGVVDGNGTIAARTLSPEVFVGKMAVPALLRSIAETPEGTEEVTTHEGIQTVTTFSRSSLSNWSVAIAVPLKDLESGLVRAT
jgi:hypothetical protein